LFLAPARPPPRKPAGGFGFKLPIPQAGKTPLPKDVPKPKPGNH